MVTSLDCHTSLVRLMQSEIGNIACMRPGLNNCRYLDPLLVVHCWLAALKKKMLEKHDHNVLQEFCLAGEWRMCC